MTINDKLSALRKAMQGHQADAVIIPSSDSHQSEYVADHWKCREWISGFTGSAGTVVVLNDFAGLWTDSRYFLQAEKELAGSEFELRKIYNYKPDFIEFLVDRLPEGASVACYGRVFSQSEMKSYARSFEQKGIRLITEPDLIGSIWTKRPPLPDKPVIPHDVLFAGRSIEKKLASIREVMATKKVGEYLLTALDDIAWTFNLRGYDIEFNPVFYAFAIIRPQDAILFANASKFEHALVRNLAGSGVVLKPYDDIYAYLDQLDPKTRLYLSGAGVNYTMYNSISCQLIDGESIVSVQKAIKNEVEIGHIRKVMEKDAVALTRLYMWLENELNSRTVTEFELGQQLAEFRSELPGYYGESFAAIAGYGPNGAIIHYRPEKETAAEIKPEGILLLDSGGQYEDGTTDITRTTALGEPSAEQKKHFTLVLKGYIALDQLEFPEGINGYQLDAFARQYLWKHGANYFHGTGHGVGFFLNVHEGPHGISFVWSDRSNRPLVPGMVTSNEPGLYLDGAYGIRIENLILTRVVRETSFGKFLGHETLTLFPIDHKLIDYPLLNKEELQWINEYHQMVYDRVSVHLTKEEKAWLKVKCARIS